MKKIVTGIAAIAMAASVFAVDFAAKVYMTGDVLNGGDGADTNLFVLKAADQKDADALVMSVNGDKAGANFQFWYNFTGDDGSTLSGTTFSWPQAIRVRGVNLWFKPIDQIKITVGNVSYGTFKEQMHWWKEITGVGYQLYYNSYSSASTVDGTGAMIDITPLAGLSINAAVAPGTGKGFVTFPNSGDATHAAWGAAVKYDLSGAAGIPVTAEIAWRDNGKADYKILAIGASYGSAWSNGIYAFLNARLRFNEKNSGKLDGVALDNYLKFTKDALQVHARVPVTIRTSGDALDPSWLLYEVKVQYAIDAYTPYIFIGNDLGNKGAIALNDKFGDTFTMQIKPGVTFNIGSCSVNLAVQLDLPWNSPTVKTDWGTGTNSSKFAWSVPFELGVAF